MDHLVTRDSYDGIVLDIGVSSPQLDQAERGFSFQKDGPLDMRMSKEGLSAAELVNTFEEAEMANIIWKYGEERFSRRIARAIVRHRSEVGEFSRTSELAQVVRSAVPKSKDGIDPATRTFQALRIYVNDELGERVVYDEEHQGGETVEILSRTKGNGKVLISLRWLLIPRSLRLLRMASNFFCSSLQELNQRKWSAENISP